MISAILSTLGVFFGIFLIILLIGVGFLSGAFKVIGAIVRGIKGLFKK